VNQDCDKSKDLHEKSNHAVRVRVGDHSLVLGLALLWRTCSDTDHRACNWDFDRSNVIEVYYSKGKFELSCQSEGRSVVDIVLIIFFV